LTLEKYNDILIMVLLITFFLKEAIPMSRFNFIGEISINEISSPNPWRRDLKTKNGKEGLGVNLSVIATQNNRAWVEGVGFVQDNIKIKNEDKTEITVDWSDRNNPEIVKDAAFFYKRTILLDPNNQDSRKEFITDYDFIKYIADNIDEIKGKKVQITGQINKDFYNGTVRDRFRMSSLYIRNSEDKNGNPVKNKFQITTVFFWDKEGIDLADWKEEKKIYINGYTEEYIDKDNGRKYVPQTLIFDCSKVNLEDEKNVKAMNFRLRQLGLVYEDGSLSVKLKKGKYYTNEIDISYKNGAEEIEFDESELTETQREAIELGMATLEDFRPKGQIYGNRVTEWKITGFSLKGKFTDGLQEMDVTTEEFEDNIYTPPKAETLADAMEESESESDDEVEDLFS
jgi:hypothetical protein